jgi:hypothetical protein
MSKSEPISVKLPTESIIGIGAQEVSSRIVNGFVEALGQESEGIMPFAIYAAPGLSRWDLGSDGIGTVFSGLHRGKIELDATHLICVIGTRVVSFGTRGDATALATLSETTPVSMAINRAATPEIGIVTGANLYYTLTGGTLTQRNIANLPAPNSITYTHGYFIYGIADGRFFQSGFEDGTTVNALAFGIANAFADKLVNVYTHFGLLYVFCSKHMEIWQAAGVTPFNFTPAQQYIELGLLAKNSVASIDKGMFWIDHEGMVRFGRDMNAQRVSTHTVERAISALSNTDKAAIYGSISTFFGHQCYVLSSSSWTWVYDIFMQRWYERASFGLARWKANAAILFNNAYIFDSTEDGSLYMLNEAAHDEDGDPLVFEAVCKNVNPFPNGYRVDKLDILVSSGVGRDVSQPYINTPYITIDYSDNGGKTYTGERTLALGGLGHFDELISTNQWGRMSHKGRVWRIRASPPVVRALISVSMTGRKANA